MLDVAWHLCDTTGATRRKTIRLTQQPFVWGHIWFDSTAANKRSFLVNHTSSEKHKEKTEEYHSIVKQHASVLVSFSFREFLSRTLLWSYSRCVSNEKVQLTFAITIVLLSTLESWEIWCLCFPKILKPQDHSIRMENCQKGVPLGILNTKTSGCGWHRSISSNSLSGIQWKYDSLHWRDSSILHWMVRDRKRWRVEAWLWCKPIRDCEIVGLWNYVHRIGPGIVFYA